MFFKRNKDSAETNDWTEIPVETIDGQVATIGMIHRTDFTLGISRQEAEYYNTKLENKAFEDIQLVRSDDLIATKVQKENKNSIQKVKLELSKILSLNASESKKISKIASLIVLRAKVRRMSY